MFAIVSPPVDVVDSRLEVAKTLGADFTYRADAKDIKDSLVKHRINVSIEWCVSCL